MKSGPAAPRPKKTGLAAQSSDGMAARLQIGRPVPISDLMGTATVSVTRDAIRVTFRRKAGGETVRRFDTPQAAICWALDAVKGRPCL
jgi:hypothetical protein